MQGNFTEQSVNELALGNHGSVKNHRLCAIGHELVQKGQGVLFISCSLLVQKLLIAKRVLDLPKYLKKMGRYDQIIISYV
jgi:DNA replication protein DnaC